MNLHTIANYLARRTAELDALEDNLLYVYVDTVGIPTIGFGVNLQIRSHALLVLRMLGLDVEGDDLTGAALAAEQGYIQDLLDALSQNYAVAPGFPPPEANAARAAVDAILLLRAQDQVYQGFPAFPPRVTDFRLAAGGDAALLDDVLNGYNVVTPTGVEQFDGYENQLDDWLQQQVGGTSVDATIPDLMLRDNIERLALLSLHYNGVLLNSPALRAALINDDRAEAWFEIRYRSNSFTDVNGNIRPLALRTSTATRRYAEASLFGLLPDNPTEADQIAVFRMYARHRNSALHGNQVAGLLGYENLFAAPAQQDLPTLFQPVADQLGSVYGKAGIPWDRILVDASGSTNANNVTVTGGANAELLFGEGGSETLVGGGGDDALVGGQGDDTLDGGAGVDTYFFNAGDGVDRVIDSDGQGAIQIDSIVLTGSLARRSGGGMMFQQWSGPLAGTTITYTFALTGVDGQGNPLGNLSIEGGGLGPDDRIVIENYSAINNFGITLDLTGSLGLVGGFLAANPWELPDYTPAVADETLREDSALALGLAANRPASSGDYALLTLSGNGGDRAKALTGAELLPFVNGSLQLALTPGETLTNLSLLSFGDFDEDEQVTLTVTLFDAQGAPISTPATMNVLFEAVDEPDGTPPIDFTHVEDPPTVPNYWASDVNEHIIGNDGVGFVDEIYAYGGSDWVQGRNGRDMLFGYYVDADQPAYNLGYLPDGEDLIEGGADGDLIYGGGEADRLYGDAAVDLGAAISDGNTAPSIAENGDVLQGGAGHDLVVGSNRIDLIGGGEGNDVLVGGGGNDLIDGDTTHLPGIDAGFHFETWLGMWGITVTIDGDDVEYEVAASKRRDYLFDYNLNHVPYEGGTDTIHAGTGNDLALAGGGDDFVDAGPGDDNVFGQDGNDTLLGGAGDDRLIAGDAGDTAGEDFLDGGEGVDRLFGSDYGDVLYGGSGDDMLQADDHTALDSDDYLNGEDGNDTLLGGGGADRLIGGAGSDELFGESSGVLSTMHGGDYLDGGEGNDTLHGRGGADTLIGGAGVDTLFGDLQSEATLYGADYLSGDAGADTLVGAGGADTLQGGDDDDQLHGDSPSTPTSVHGADQIDGGVGNDTVFGGGGDDSVVGGEGNDIVYGEAGNDQLRGDAGDDYLSGDAGSDSLSGGDGADTLYGGDGNDFLTAGVGADYLNGGAGNDTYLFSAADLAPVNFVLDTLDDTSGNDVVMFDASMSLGDLVVGSPPGSGNLRISNSSGTAILSIAGLLAGNSSVREFRFATGEVVSAHQLIGERYGQPISAYSFESNIFMFGGNQADYITSDGNDVTISGGLGDDNLTGGFGLTKYLFTRGDGNDYIYDENYGSGVLNTLELTDVFVPELSLHYSQATGARLLISDGGGSIQLGLFDIANVFSPRTIDEIRFADAEMTMTWAEFLNASGIDIGGGLGSVLNGTSVSDRITGSSTNETINAGAGNDRVDGGLGNDAMDGGAGSDTYLFGVGSGQDTINNSDTAAGKTDVLLINGALTRPELRFVRYEDALVVRVAASGDRVFVSNFFNGAGLDEIRVSGGIVYTPANIVLDDVQSQVTSGNDEVYGSPAGDVIDALAGNDAVFAGGGDDTVVGNSGNDVLRGDAGNDSLDGGTGNDTLYGGDGNDVLTAAMDLTDTMYGEAGNDQLTGLGTLDGGAGDDLITGRGTLTDGEGDDALTAMTGGASMWGGDGNDHLLGTTTSNDSLRGGAGNDVLDTGSYTSGSSASDWLEGGEGSDTYIVQAHNSAEILQDDSSTGRFDVLRFGPGVLPSQARFSSYWQGDLFIHFDGSSTLVQLFGYLADDTLTKKFDQIVFDSDPGTVWTPEQLTALAMAPSNEDQLIRGTSGNDVLTGLGGEDIIHALDGNDQIFGGDDQDELFGDAGDDELTGGEGFDELQGGLGNDTYYYNLGDGNDQIAGGTDPGTIDAIVFGPGIAPENMTVRRGTNLNDIMLRLYDPITGFQLGSVQVVNGFGTNGADILDEVRFSDAAGTVWSRADLLALVLSGNGTDEGIIGFATDDLIRGNGGHDRLDGGFGNDDLSGGTGNDWAKGGTGNDTFRFGHGQGYDEISDISGVNRIVLDAGILPADVTLYRTSSGSSHYPIFQGTSSWLPAKTSDALVLVLNGTGEQIWVRNFFDGQTPRPISEIVFANGTIWDAAAIDANTTNLGGTANSVTGTAGDDSYTADHPNDGITEASGGGTDSVTSSVTYTLPANVENLTLTGLLNLGANGNALVNTLVGNSGDNVFSVGYFPTTLNADTLIGGLGNDTYEVDRPFNLYIGGTNYFDDIVIEAPNEGYDTIISHSHSAVLPANVEALVMSSWDGIYDAIAQVYTGNALDNTLDARFASAYGYGFTMDGGAGADLMIGPSNPSFHNNVDRIIRYIVDNPGDVVIGGAQNVDLVRTSLSYVLPSSVERLELTGSDASTGTGHSGDNYLNGSMSTGANALYGGGGNDEYTLGAGDTAVENPGEGIDTLIFTVSASPLNAYNLESYANFENITVTNAAGFADLVGTVGDNQLVGNASPNRITGGAGNDQLTGGASQDTYDGFGVGSGADVITDTAGVDTMRFALNQNTQIEQLTFSQVGSNLRIAITAQDSITVQSWFSGTTNAIESLDLYEDGWTFTYTKAQIDAKVAGTNLAPVVYSAPFAQVATATESFSYQLNPNTFLDIGSQHSLVYTATRTDGTALPAWLLFDSMTRTFSGTPTIGDAGSIDVRVTATDQGSLSTPVTFTIAVQTPPIEGTSGDDILVGDNNDNVIYGLEGNDTVQGLGGNDELWGDEDDDTLQGGLGDDYLFGWSENDVLYGDEGVDELYGGDGTDALHGGLDDDYLEGEAGNDALYGDDGIDELNGQEGDDQLFGGSGDDMLDGRDGNDLLDGGTGADEMFGYEGDDTYVVDSINDFIDEDLTGGDGTDTVRSSVTYTLVADLENLILTGSATGINGTGNGLVNVLDGRENTAANVLSGGAGDDMYYVGTGDTVSEGSNGGTDTVYSGLSSYTITDSDVENLTLTGTGNINGTGNSGVNTLTGNSGNNALSGGTGADTMLGGAGNDTYTVDNVGDVVTENGGEGTDLVNASVSYTISDDDVENLTLTGTSGLSAVGNSSNNVLTGNSGNNTLTGLGGNDTLNGGSGSDVMVGGQGDDTYVFGTGDTITENSGEGIDLVQSSVAHTLGNHLENLTLTGTSNINGTGNALDNVLTGNSGTNTLTGNDGNDTMNGGGGTDTMVGGLGNDVYYVDSTNDVTTESANQGIDTITSSVTRTLVSNIELLFLTGTSAINGTGNSVANIVRGNGLVNTLQGGGGTDMLEGGAGADILSNTTGTPENSLFNGGADNDTLTGTANKDLLIGGLGNDAITTGQGADIIVFNQGEGQDTVAASTTKDNALSLGGGILYADLLFQKSGNNLILKAGGTDQITFTNYYASPSNRSVDKLQVVIEGTSDYDSGSGDALRNKKIATFNFDGLVAAFDAALAADPGLTTWALTNALVAQHLGGSDTAAIGGDLAYRYGRFDTLSDISFTPAVAILAAAGFGTTAQTLQSLGSLQDSSARLS